MPWAFWKLFTHSYTISLTKKSLQCCRANTLEVLCIPQIKASVIEKLIIFQNFKYLKNDHYFTPCKLRIKTSLIYAQMNRCLPLCWTIALIFTREKCVTSIDSFCHCRDGFFLSSGYYMGTIIYFFHWGTTHMSILVYLYVYNKIGKTHKMKINHRNEENASKRHENEETLTFVQTRFPSR